jgi:hypothetical protein
MRSVLEFFFELALGCKSSFLGRQLSLTVYWLVRERGVGEEERATERGAMSKRGGQ